MLYNLNLQLGQPWSVAGAGRQVSWSLHCKRAHLARFCWDQARRRHFHQGSHPKSAASPRLWSCWSGPWHYSQAEWVTYPYSIAHPILQWLPSKLAEWIAENHGQELAIPAKRWDKWTVEELNNILASNLVPFGPTGGQLRMFGTIQWESELYRGRPKACCYPFNLHGHHGARIPRCSIAYIIYYMTCYITILAGLCLPDCSISC